jgi:hypothetical protein
LFIPAAQADSSATVTVSLGPPQFINTLGELITPFGDLNGTPVNGQSESITVLFANREFIFSPGYDFDAGLVLQTSGVPCSGFFASGTGSFHRSANGAPLFSPIQLGSACGSNGELAVGIEFPPLTGPYSVYGFQFNVTYPDSPGGSIGQGDLLLSFDNPDPAVFIEPLPETATWTLLLAGIALLGLIRFRTSRAV